MLLEEKKEKNVGRERQKQPVFGIVHLRILCGLYCISIWQVESWRLTCLSVSLNDQLNNIELTGTKTLFIFS